MDEVYGFVLRALDPRGDTEWKSSSTTVFIRITDVNDNPPKFDRQSYEASVRENDYPPKLFEFSVQDSDFGDNAKIQVTLQDPSGLANRLFSVVFQPVTPGHRPRNEVMLHSTTPPSMVRGHVQLLHKLDAEQLPKQINFHLVATDSGSPQLSSKVAVKINLINVNDAAPIITFVNEGKKLAESRLDLTENVTPVNAIVAQIHVMDRDSPLDQITCQLGGEGASAFQLDPVNDPQFVASFKTYVLRTKTELDREQKAMFWVSSIRTSLCSSLLNSPLVVDNARIKK
ncbi:hypothetical protein Ciccas_013356 [Cichlidogyrus casuarinus]|uniref:Cadherin domain-containing protein n=1 Tax=Cichlidogyrus casuarinus TaxID=1844966 RepID=A0ABD2PKT1_9PLAT